MYDAMVGAGTYIFSLDGDRNVDATRTGNIAHLLNHSCAPNCFTRIVNAAGQNRVIIFALRDLKVRLKESRFAQETASKTDETNLFGPPHNASSAPWSSPPSLQRSISLARTRLCLSGHGNFSRAPSLRTQGTSPLRGADTSAQIERP